MRKMSDFLTDLALEARGARHKTGTICGFSATESVLKGSRALSLKIDAENARVADAAQAISRAISAFFPSDFSLSSSPVTVICLGNAAFTADSLGSLCAPKITATRHLKTEKPEIFSALGGVEISVICSGVAANTGVNALEMAKMCTRTLGSRLIITVDALKAASPDNLCRVVQVTNGVSPGSGVGNNRPDISAQTVGVPVISVGVPTVISSQSLISKAPNSPTIAPVSRVSDKSSLLVSPIDCDLIIKRYAKIIAMAINLTLIGVFSE